MMKEYSPTALMHLLHRLPMYLGAGWLSQRIEHLSEDCVDSEIRAIGKPCTYCFLRLVIPAFPRLAPFAGALAKPDRPLSLQLQDWLRGRCGEEEMILAVRQHRLMFPANTLHGVVCDEFSKLKSKMPELDQKRILRTAKRLDPLFILGTRGPFT